MKCLNIRLHEKFLLVCENRKMSKVVSQPLFNWCIMHVFLVCFTVKNLQMNVQKEKENATAFREKLNKSQTRAEQLDKDLKILQDKLENYMAKSDHEKSIAECSK